MCQHDMYHFTTSKNRSSGLSILFSASMTISGCCNWFVILSSIDFLSKINVGRVILDKSHPGLNWEIIPNKILWPCSSTSSISSTFLTSDACFLLPDVFLLTDPDRPKVYTFNHVSDQLNYNFIFRRSNTYPATLISTKESFEIKKVKSLKGRKYGDCRVSLNCSIIKVVVHQKSSPKKIDFFQI